MRPEHVWKWGAILALFTLLAVLFIDRPLATALEGSARDARSLLHAPIDALEMVFGFPVSKFLTGAVILAIALVLFAFPRFRSTAWLLLLLSLSQLTTRLAAGVLKNVFLRPRPYEALAGDGWNGRFFTDGSSFPSGHAAHFWPFFFVAMLAFPRWRIPTLLLAVFVSLSRVAVNDHFLGDVTASATIAAFVSYAYARALVPRAARATL